MVSPSKSFVSFPCFDGTRTDHVHRLLFSMKLEKSIVQRRLDLMADEGVVRHLFLRGYKVNAETGFIFILIDVCTQRARWCRHRCGGLEGRE